ncbi:hypothetical protein BDR03DRAFT_967975 [Suillus americanus]|nr:hypothetical protein BDR03DRAFT_967975 [Suillus americanus]
MTQGEFIPSTCRFTPVIHQLPSSCPRERVAADGVYMIFPLRSSGDEVLIFVDLSAWQLIERFKGWNVQIKFRGKQA